MYLHRILEVAPPPPPPRKARILKFQHIGHALASKIWVKRVGRLFGCFHASESCEYLGERILALQLLNLPVLSWRFPKLSRDILLAVLRSCSRRGRGGHVCGSTLERVGWYYLHRFISILRRVYRAHMRLQEFLRD